MVLAACLLHIPAQQRTGPAPGGMTAGLADRFVTQLTPAAIEVLALLSGVTFAVASRELAIPLATRLISQDLPGCNGSDGEPDPTCGNALRRHQAEGWWLTSNP
jgi:hypothetical protein